MKNTKECNNPFNVIQPNRITTLYYESGITAVQLKMMGSIVALIQDKMTRDPESVITDDDCILTISARDCISNRHKERFFAAVEELVGKKVSYRYYEEKESGNGQKKGSYHRCLIVPFVSYDKEEESSSAKIRVNKDFLPILLCWNRGYTMFDLNVVKSLSRASSIQLYQYLCLCHDRHVMEIRISDIRDWLNFDEKRFPRPTDVKKEFERAVKDINESSSMIKCTTEYRKTRQAGSSAKSGITSVVIHITNNLLTASPQEADEQDSIIDTLRQDLTQELGIDMIVAEKIILHLRQTGRLTEFREDLTSALVKFTDRDIAKETMRLLHDKYSFRLF